MTPPSTRKAIWNLEAQVRGAIKRTPGLSELRDVMVLRLCDTLHDIVTDYYAEVIADGAVPVPEGELRVEGFRITRAGNTMPCEFQFIPAPAPS